MAGNIKSVKGLFGQLIHYKDGQYAGESWPGMFKGSYDHYKADGEYSGYSDPGFVASLVHRDADGKRIGATYDDDFGHSTHYDVNGYVGNSFDGLTGTNTDLLGDTDLFGDD